MAILLSQDHPAYSRLKSRNVPVRPCSQGGFSRAASRPETAVTLGFVNVMPTVYLDETVDLLLTRLAYARHDVRPVFISPEQDSRKGISWQQARLQPLDSILVTGYAASDLPFEELHFWNELKTIVRESEARHLPLFGVCAGAMAVANITYGIAKEKAAHKLLGNYEYKTAQGENYFLATSRHNTLNRQDLLRAVHWHGIEILSQTEQTPQPEPGVIVDRRRNWLLALAHLEYAYETCDSYPDFEGQPLHILDYQYRRDHNTKSPKYNPELAARVHPPVNLELDEARVVEREQYAKRLLSDWVEDSFRQRLTREVAQQVREKASRHNTPVSPLLTPGYAAAG